MNFQMFKLVLDKTEEPEIKLPTSTDWIIEIERQLQKHIYFYFIDYAKPFECVNHNELWKVVSFNLSFFISNFVDLLLLFFLDEFS